MAGRDPGTGTPTAPAPGLVTLTVWGVAPSTVPAALARMALDRVHLRRVPGLRFAKLLGTGAGRTFTPRDADLLHWALLAVWDRPEHAGAFASSTTHRRWSALSTEALEVAMRPVSSRGRWAGREPFTTPAGTLPPGTLPPGTGQDARPAAVAAVTRARLRPGTVGEFWRAVPPVADDLHRAPGLVLALGIGEAPLGLQGTFSLWTGAPALEAFAYRSRAHRAAIAATPRRRWFTEELFTRFAVLSVQGTHAGRRPGDLLALPGTAAGSRTGGDPAGTA